MEKTIIDYTKQYPSPKIEQSEESIDIAEFEDAQEFIKNAIEKGYFPIISVPEQYANAAKNGIKPHATWIGEEIVAGTIMRSPYLPQKEKRRLFKIKTNPEQIKPRFTGDNKHFHGVVIFDGPITTDMIEEIQIH